MKYISQQSTGAFDLIRYEDYLDREREGLEARISGADLLSIGRFVPTGPGSFHDARFERLSVVTEIRDGGGDEEQSLTVELCLKGPFFDRQFHLDYKDVVSCRFGAPAPEDDLLMHEVRIEQGQLLHELRFSGGQTIEIACRELMFSERLYTAKAQGD